MAIYRGREVQVLRDAVKGDPGWGVDDNLVIVQYRQTGDKETVRKGEVVDTIEDSNRLHDFQTNPQPIEGKPIEKPATLAEPQRNRQLKKVQKNLDNDTVVRDQSKIQSGV